MKIGIDARMYGVTFTGIGRYSSELIKNLAKQDGEHEYVIFMRKEAFDSFEVPNKRFKKVLADFPHYSFGEQFGFLSIINKEKLDLMHFTHFNAPIFYSRPFVVTIHDLTLSFFPGKKMTNWFQRLAYHIVVRNVTRKAKKIIAVSKNTKKDLIDALKIPSDKIEVIYNGVSFRFGDVEPTPHPDLMPKLGLQKPYFLYTGVWRDHKNIVGMIKAFDAFNKDVGSQYNLVITGPHNPTYHEIPDIIKELGVEGDVHLVGLVAEGDLLALYQGALAYVFPSFYEGFGLPPLEAMQCGTPVIASNTSATPEVCGEGNALFFDPYNLEDMQKAMRTVATDASVRQRLVNRGFERVKDFSWEKMTKNVLDIYNSF
ncbi:glycosyltransferase family 4 protein [Patescibacteria group bacterium]|nr:glycosyltransferase family 4 protein [Patescibacteria group bacterium]MBU1683231.1 glycosyltransferase family 4 protein [Patescibacteria group bacterium]MBU1935742.1 glycosyltransferase family 4 protein [Patescibacteria group bacterium]